MTSPHNKCQPVNANPSQNAVTGSSGTHPVPEGAADKAPPAIQFEVQSAVAARLQASYDKVKEWPEKSPTGFMDLLELRNLVPEAIAALAGSVAQAAWQPIETAPRDGTRILATGGGLGREVDIVSYNERVGAWNATNYTLDDRDDEADGYSRPALWTTLLPSPSLPSAEGK